MYKEFNLKKIERAISIMPKKGDIAFKLIPLLIQANQDKLPGYTKSRILPGRIERFHLPKDTEKVFKTYFPDIAISTHKLSSLSHAEVSIESILLMGSIGSLVQGDKSDFDYWICYDGEKTKEDALNKVRNKLKSIEEWACQYDMEVHFFMSDINSVRRNLFGDIDKESAGSALGKILKEEFYRTHTHVSGKPPLWWCMPPSLSDEDYEDLKTLMFEHPRLEPTDFVDLGNVADVSSSEYYGAALWQINKALDSPYKSVLKIALLERFISNNGTNKLLSEDMKERLFSYYPEVLDSLDPYRIMFDRILEHYSISGRGDVVDLLRRSLYIKAGVAVGSGVIKKKEDYKSKVMREYVEEWGWKKELVKELDQYNNWDFDEMIALGDKVHKFLIQTYKNLTDSLKKEAQVERKISNEDLAVLGRKLFSFYSQKPHKVEFIKNIFHEKLLLKDFSFDVSVNKSGKHKWSLYQGHITHDKQKAYKKKRLKKGEHLIDIVAWMVINKICNKNSSYYLIPNSLHITLPDIQRIIDEIRAFFPIAPISAIQNSDLLSDSRKIKVFAAVNLFSQHWVDKVEEVSIVYSTSWGEYFCNSYSGMQGVRRFMQYITDLAPKTKGELSSASKIYIPQGKSVARIESEIFNLVMKGLKIK